MGVRIMEGREYTDGAILYCSVTMWAFGPVFEDAYDAQQFLDWLGPDDPRMFSDPELRSKYEDWLEEKEQEKEEA